MFIKKTEDHKIRKEDIDFYIEQAKTLTLPYEEQYKQLSMLNDYITNDIASDWIWSVYESSVMQMFNQNLINNDVVNLYKEIDKNFYDVSFDGALFDEDFWTLNGLKNHPLWEKQRCLAKELVTLLEKIEIS